MGRMTTPAVTGAAALAMPGAAALADIGSASAAQADTTYVVQASSSGQGQASADAPAARSPSPGVWDVPLTLAHQRRQRHIPEPERPPYQREKARRIPAGGDRMGQTLSYPSLARAGVPRTALAESCSVAEVRTSQLRIRDVWHSVITGGPGRGAGPWLEGMSAGRVAAWCRHAGG